MNIQRNWVCGLLASVAMACGLGAQSLQLGWRGDDGAMAETAVLPVLGTGRLVGTLTTPTTERDLEYVVGYYSQTGRLLFSEARQEPGGRVWFVFQPKDHRLAAQGGVGNSFSVSLPIGVAGGAQLPVGNFTVRIWAGRAGNMRYDGTGVPISGYVTTATAPVMVQDVPYGIYTSNPRAMPVGAAVPMRVLTSQPVRRDTVLRVYGSSALGELSVSQVMIPRGQTCSAEFVLATGSSPVEGQVVVRDDVGVEARSSMLKLVTMTDPEYHQGDEVPELDQWAYCAKKAKWRSYGTEEQVCGDCEENPTSPNECHVGPGEAKAHYDPADCADWFWDECEYFIENHANVQTYAASNTFNQSCGGTKWHIEGGVVVGGSIGGATGEATGSISVSGETIEYRKCCLVRPGPRVNKQLIQCRTID